MIEGCSSCGKKEFKLKDKIGCKWKVAPQEDWDYSGGIARISGRFGRRGELFRVELQHFFFFLQRRAEPEKNVLCFAGPDLPN